MPATHKPRAPPGVEPAAYFDSTRENLPGPDIARVDRLIALSRLKLKGIDGRAPPGVEPAA